MSRGASSGRRSTVEAVHEVDVRWGHLDPVKIVFYPHIFAWADAGAHELFRTLGIDLVSWLAKRQIGLGLVSCRADFSAPARYRDRLRCRSWVARVGRASFDFVHEIERPSSRRTVAVVHETRVCMDLSRAGKLRARALPADLRARLEASVRPPFPNAKNRR